jgi:hypothetical protein
LSMTLHVAGKYRRASSLGGYRVGQVTTGGPDGTRPEMRTSRKIARPGPTTNAWYESVPSRRQHHAANERSALPTNRFDHGRPVADRPPVIACICPTVIGDELANDSGSFSAFEHTYAAWSRAASAGVTASVGPTILPSLLHADPVAMRRTRMAETRRTFTQTKPYAFGFRIQTVSLPKVRP